MLKLKNLLGKSSDNLVTDSGNIRRNFIIIPYDDNDVEGKIVLSTVERKLTQRGILEIFKFREEIISKILMNSPSGYVIGNKVFVFQGDLSKPETLMKISPKNMEMIKRHMPSLQEMLGYNKRMSIYFHAQGNKVMDSINNFRTNIHDKIVKYKTMITR